MTRRQAALLLQRRAPEAPRESPSLRHRWAGHGGPGRRWRASAASQGCGHGRAPSLPRIRMAVRQRAVVPVIWIEIKLDHHRHAAGQ